MLKPFGLALLGSNFLLLLAFGLGLFFAADLLALGFKFSLLLGLVLGDA